MAFRRIEQSERDAYGVVSLAIRPNQPAQYGEGGLSGVELKRRFDRLVNRVIDRYNELCDILNNPDEAAKNIPIKLDGEVSTLYAVLSSITDGEGNILVHDPFPDAESQEISIDALAVKLFAKLSEASIKRNTLTGTGGSITLRVEDGGVYYISNYTSVTISVPDTTPYSAHLYIDFPSDADSVTLAYPESLSGKGDPTDLASPGDKWEVGVDGVGGILSLRKE